MGYSIYNQTKKGRYIMGLRLGNISLDELTERYLGVELTQEDYEWFKDSHEDKVSGKNDPDYEISKDAWHCFHLPSVQIHAGSKAMANKIVSRLTPYMEDGKFHGEISKLAVTYEKLEEKKFGYVERKRVEDEELEVFYGYYDNDFTKESMFFLKTRGTESGNIFLLELGKNYNGGRWNNYTQVVPDLDKPATREELAVDENGVLLRDEEDNLIDENAYTVKEIRRKRTDNNRYTIVPFERYKKMDIRLWDGEPKQNRLKSDKRK